MFTAPPPDDLLAPIAATLCEERRAAISARSNAGLDAIWQKAREQFQGIDERNRGMAQDGVPTMDAPLVLSGFAKTGAEDRSTVFDNITRPYTETGTSKVSDILLPTGKMPWDLEPSPVSDAETVLGILASYPELTGLVPLVPGLSEKLARTSDETTFAVATAKRYITDYLKECQWMGEIREQILEAGKVGTGVIKGPVPKYTRPSAELDGFVQLLPEDLRQDLITKLFYRPVSECIRVENFFPDPKCGHDHQKGAFVWERVPDVSKRELSELRDDPQYFVDQIDACLKEGPKDPKGNPRRKESPFEIWIRTGTLCLKQLFPEAEESSPSLFVVAELCNDRIIKIAKYWLDTPTFHYDLLCWEARDNSWAGIGIPERIETPQRGLNASLRAMHDNLAWSVGPQVLERKGLIEPRDGKWVLSPYKIWDVVEDLFNKDIKAEDAFKFLEFPNYSQAILPIIQYWLSRAEQVAGLPLLLQGQASTDSVGVSQQLQNNATTNLRQIVKACDDKVFIPHITRYYEWVQLYGPSNAKADAKVIALGSSVLVVREIQQQILLQVLDRSLQPQFKLSPSRIMQAILEGNQLEYKLLALTPEEEEELRKAQEQPDPSVQVAQINAEVDKYEADLQHQTELLKIRNDAGGKQLEYKKAMDVTETQVAGQIAGQAVKDETQTKIAAVKAGAPARAEKAPAPKEPEMDPEAALNALGLVA